MLIVWVFLMGFRIDTPITLRHEMVTDVFFSVYDLDENGKKMAKPGPGALRLMRRKRAIIIPFVCPLNSNVSVYRKTDSIARACSAVYYPR
jgi:hypothetical protein